MTVEWKTANKIRFYQCTSWSPFSLCHTFLRLKLILSIIYRFHLLLIYLIIKRCNLFKEPWSTLLFPAFSLLLYYLLLLLTLFKHVVWSLEAWMPKSPVSLHIFHNPSNSFFFFLTLSHRAPQQSSQALSTDRNCPHISKDLVLLDIPLFGQS